MTRQYFSDQRNLHSHDDMNVVDHPKSGEKERRNLYGEDTRQNLLEKANNIITNRKVLTYVGSALALGVIIGTASMVTYRLRKRRSPAYLINKWFSDRLS